MTPQEPLDPSIDFSILHATARLPDGWMRAAIAWASCDRMERVQYVLAIDADQWNARPVTGGQMTVVCNPHRDSAVDAWNAAARCATGRVLILASDDLFPPAHWDAELRRVIPDLDGEYVVRVDNGPYCPELITHPMLTRAYYLRPGRGGHPNGELFYPEYLSMGADDDFTAVAERDGVVVDARHLKFPHRHYRTGEEPIDEVYRWTNRREAWLVKRDVLARRVAEGFGIARKETVHG